MHLRFPHHTLALAACLAAAIAAVPHAGLAQGSGDTNAAVGKRLPPAEVFDKLLSGEEKEIVDLAEAMPADKFSFAPATSMGNYAGVSSFSAQVKHIASANYGFFRPFNVPGGKSRADFEKITSREDILAALKSSYLYAHAAIKTITPENAFVDLDGKGTTRAGMAAYSLEHNNDHYGQLVEYLRMNGIIPPASRR